MKLGETIKIEIAGERFELRPTLKAATDMHRRYGFDVLLKSVSEGKISVVAEILATGSNRDRRSIDNAFAAKPVREILTALTVPVFNYVLALAGADEPATKDKPKDTGEAMPHDKAHVRLFEIGTGILGWTPETTWNATPAEILAAFKGKMEFERAKAGATDEQPGSTDHTAAEIKRGRAKLKAMTRGGGGRVFTHA